MVTFSFCPQKYMGHPFEVIGTYYIHAYSHSLTLCLLVATCHLLKTLENSLVPDQARLSVGPDLDPNCLSL